MYTEITLYCSRANTRSQNVGVCAILKCSKKIKQLEVDVARALVPHSWRRQWTADFCLTDLLVWVQVMPSPKSESRFTRGGYSLQAVIA